MYWKVSINRSFPIVESEGFARTVMLAWFECDCAHACDRNLDPFDGYITYRLLQETSEKKDVLEEELKSLHKMVQRKYAHYTSSDALDLGEALWIAHFYPNEDWSRQVSSTSARCLEV